jgi:hypothetical protein
MSDEKKQELSADITYTMPYGMDILSIKVEGRAGRVYDATLVVDEAGIALSVGGPGWTVEPIIAAHWDWEEDEVEKDYDRAIGPEMRLEQRERQVIELSLGDWSVMDSPNEEFLEACRNYADPGFNVDALVLRLLAEGRITLPESRKGDIGTVAPLSEKESLYERMQKMEARAAEMIDTAKKKQQELRRDLQQELELLGTPSAVGTTEFREWMDVRRRMNLEMAGTTTDRQIAADQAYERLDDALAALIAVDSSELDRIRGQHDRDEEMSTISAVRDVQSALEDVTQYLDVYNYPALRFIQKVWQITCAREGWMRRRASNV